VAQAIGLKGDVRKKDDASRVVNTVVEQFGKLDILVNGAAGNFLVAAEDLSPNGFKTGKCSWFICCPLIFRSHGQII
jgi:peroxisomal 2,4-dienoyl-CoA reductase